MTTMIEQFETCRKKFLSKLDYYKLMLRTVLLSLGIITIIVVAVVAASYNPIRDIAILKTEIKNINDKLDVIIENGKTNKKKSPKLTLSDVKN